MKKTAHIKTTTKMKRKKKKKQMGKNTGNIVDNKIKTKT